MATVDEISEPIAVPNKYFLNYDPYTNDLKPD